MEYLRQLFLDAAGRDATDGHERRLNLSDEFKYGEAAAITMVCFALSMVALSSIYSMCKSRRAREGMGYREVQRPDNSFEMSSLGGREGVSMVLPQGY